MLLLFGIELGIGFFVHDRWIRPFLGDVLVVILLYCTLRAFFRISTGLAAGLVLAFAFCVETLQYLKIVDILGLQGYTWARIVIGTTFAWSDLLAYTLGVVLVLVIELARGRKLNGSTMNE